MLARSDRSVLGATGDDTLRGCYVPVAVCANLWSLVFPGTVLSVGGVIFELIGRDRNAPLVTSFAWSQHTSQLWGRSARLAMRAGTCDDKPVWIATACKLLRPILIESRKPIPSADSAICVGESPCAPGASRRSPARIAAVQSRSMHSSTARLRAIPCATCAINAGEEEEPHMSLQGIRPPEFRRSTAPVVRRTSANAIGGPARMSNDAPIKEGRLLEGVLFTEPMRVENVRPAGPDVLLGGLAGIRSERFRKVTLTSARGSC